ncbi:sensor histidine kinase [Microtetraspora malaysiensis]|uniref:sensor histidine kinase n=1 Tax=Microtetraspora malaysiensis TaxID=161358 RepID=UPI003D9134C8
MLPRLVCARDPDRPFLFSVVFWVVLTATAVSGYASYRGPIGATAPFAVNLALVTVLWFLLPWRRAAGWRRLPAVTFLLATFVLGMTGSAEVHMLLTLIAIANVAFVHGMRTAWIVIGCMSCALFLSTGVLFGRGAVEAVAQTAPFLVFAAFVLGMTSAVLEARRRRAEAQRLLARVRELTVAQERARMGAEMHDSIGHHLTVIKISLENAERFRSRRPEAAWDEVRQAKETTVAAMADARRWVRALRPLALEGQVSSAALERLAASFDGTGLAVSFEVVGGERPLEPDVELVLYRVLQEGLTNAVRHAAARHVRGVLAFDDGRVVLEVADDGRGRDRDARGGFGLCSLAERARAVGGTLTTDDSPGGGFTLRAELPVPTKLPDGQGLPPNRASCTSDASRMSGRTLGVPLAQGDTGRPGRTMVRR